MIGWCLRRLGLVRHCIERREGLSLYVTLSDAALRLPPDQLRRLVIVEAMAALRDGLRTR